VRRSRLSGALGGVTAARYIRSCRRASICSGVAETDDPVRFRALPVDLDLSGATRLLRLRSRFEQARHVQPDIEPDSVN
jgi:hypothetical protein